MYEIKMHDLLPQTTLHSDSEQIVQIGIIGIDPSIHRRLYIYIYTYTYRYRYTICIVCIPTCIYMYTVLYVCVHVYVYTCMFFLFLLSFDDL
jgi:hypothetical protein